MAEASTAALARAASEAVRRTVAASNARLDRREQRIRDFAERYEAADQAHAAQAEHLRTQLAALLPNESSVVAAERTRLEAQRAQRDAARREEQSTAVALEAARAKDLEDGMPPATVDTTTWFYTPAARTPLAHAPSWARAGA